MSARPRLLDLFCGAGGAAVGYHRAGFEVAGVDIAPQPNYPFTAMFGLGVHRPRLFETNWLVLVPQKPPADPTSIGVYGKDPDGRLLWRRADGTEQRAAGSLEEGREAMGIDWMPWRPLTQAIPPAYCELIGAQLLDHLRVKAAA